MLIMVYRAWFLDQADKPGEELLPGVRQAVHRPQDLRLQRGHRTGRRADGVAALRGHDVQVRIVKMHKRFSFTDSLRVIDLDE